MLLDELVPCPTFPVSPRLHFGYLGYWFSTFPVSNCVSVAGHCFVFKGSADIGTRGSAFFSHSIVRDSSPVKGSGLRLLHGIS